MVVLDTDHISLLERSATPESQRLIRRLTTIAPEEAAVTIVSYEEQTRGWMAYLARSRTLARQVEAYARLKRHLYVYRAIPVLDFDSMAAIEYEKLRRARIRIGTMDLKIAAITLANGAVLLTRNLKDFREVPGLHVEDWAT
jgi:tRNA(fMet)-specific endonuclease VapC